MLGLPAQFDLDPRVIETAYFERSKELHPDRFATAPAAERVAVLSRSRALNDAYQIVKKPIARAEYLLSRAGITIGDNERLDGAFLMRVLEMREELAEAKVAKDHARLQDLRDAMAKRRDEALGELASHFASGALAEVKRVLMSLRYVDRYLEECDNALDDED